MFKPVIIPAGDRITLNETEKNIFQLLKGCVAERGLKVELRVAGGWVRDKLLKIDCKDVDIALDTMMGEAFAGHLQEFMKEKNLEARGVGVIHSNPDRSKHLETATICIFGQPIDFVNLRAEEYASDSRIPEKVEFGTPLQDALRRDITINTLFYHIQNETIEDWTGRGLMDLEEGIIRTPLATEITLLDDPLRLLRIIRFASRYGYALVPEIIEASTKPNVQEAFKAKVSRERVGIEFHKTISDPNGMTGLCLYLRLKAFPLLVMQDDSIDYHRLVELFQSVVLPHLTAEDRRLAFLCLPLLPFCSPADKILTMVKNILKLPNKDSQDAHRIFKETKLISDYSSDQCYDPIKLGRLVKSVGSNWRLAIRFSCLNKAFHSYNESAEQLTEEHEKLIFQIESLSLANAWNFAPLLTGNDVAKIVGVSGKMLGEKLVELMDWQFAHPLGSTDEAKEYLLSLKSQ